MRTALLAACFVFAISTANAADYVRIEMYDNPGAAANAIRFSEGSSLIPTPMAPAYDPWTGSMNRISWMATTGSYYGTQARSAVAPATGEMTQQFMAGGCIQTMGR